MFYAASQTEDSTDGRTGPWLVHSFETEEARDSFIGAGTLFYRDLLTGDFKRVDKRAVEGAHSADFVHTGPDNEGGLCDLSEADWWELEAPLLDGRPQGTRVRFWGCDGEGVELYEFWEPEPECE